MICKCEATERIVEKLREHNTKLAYAFSFDRESSSMNASLQVATIIIEKKRGARPVVVTPAFCPFCGATL